jgi:signal transduction histidine kinase/ActR/RegA family two-component response regulator
MTTFGYAAGAIEPGNKSWTSRIHPDDVDRVVDGIHRSIDTGAESWAAEYRFRCRQGTYAVVQDNGFILRDASGKGVRMVGGMRDRTEQKRIDAQYLRTQRMESIGTLAGGIAHDLNNVLAPILMSIDLLRPELANDSRRSEILDTIHLSCRRGADLVQQVLTFARGVDGERIGIRLRHLINDLKGMIRETFPRDITIVCHVDDELWLVAGDPTQLHQVLLNLAVNARDAMPHGGTLTITASNIVLDAQYAAVPREFSVGRYVLLQVSDTGEGIRPEIRERIFEPFFTTKEVGKGSGLGLATVHSIVKSHGGFVTLDSDVGSGTTFKVYLPADLTHESAEAVPPLQAGVVRGRDELVLVVDDESSIRDLTRHTLEAFGYRVITARDGAEAVARYAEQGQQIAVVVIDRMMPVMDGVAAIKVLRSINPSVKIIASSGLGGTGKPAPIDRDGACAFLAKPYTAQTLVRLIRNVIDQPVGRPS